MKQTSFFVLFCLLFLTHCSNPNNDTTEGSALAPGKGEPIELIEGEHLPADILTGMYPPFDVAKEAPALEQAIFAWKEMIALSWKSTYSPANIKRGVPDENYNFAQGTPDDPLVWETFAHRVEYRPKGDVITKDFDSTPSYEFTLKGEEGEDVTIDWNNINPSEHFVVLDEDNEIGSCYVFADAQDGTVSTENQLVMYMAKVNEVEYNFRKDHFNSNEAIKSALNKIKTDSLDANGNIVKNAKGKAVKTAPKYSKLKEISDYKDTTGKDPCGALFFANDTIISFPCSDETSKQRGVMEIKTAWRPMTDADIEDEFLVREAVVFEEEEENTLKAYKKKYVLIGMHILHKTNNFRHFFIATWEHNSLEQYGYKYVVVPDALPAGHDSELGKVLPVRREESGNAYSRDALAYYAVSNAVQNAIKKENPKHFLANYRLTGYQSDVYVDETLEVRKTKMPAYYLANLVIESDDALSKFSGSSTAAPFDNGRNIFANGQASTTGGCSGCHGVAQLKGADFSFVTDVFNKPVPYPEARKLTKELVESLKIETILKQEGMIQEE